MDWLSLLLPLAYLATLIGSLATFSSLYRRRQAAKAASLAPWFPPHLQRNIYLTLLEHQSNPPTPDTKIPESLLRAALFRRAVADVHRLLGLRAAKPALHQLLQRGSVGDDLWQRFQIAEKEMEVELKDVVEEANALSGPAGGWGQTIFQSASEAAHREDVVTKLKALEGSRAGVKAEWAARREGVRAGFLKELESESGGTADGGGDAASSSSEEEGEGVIVDGVAASGGGGGARKRKKNKK